jgi:predicted ATPase
MTFLESLVGKQVRIHEQRFSNTTNRYERVGAFGKFCGFGIKAVTEFEVIASETCAIIFVEDTQKFDLFSLKDIEFLDNIVIEDKPIPPIRHSSRSK